jgi:diacylglycerol kinase family enzyme
MAVPPIVFNITADGESFDVEASGVFVSNVEDLGIGKVPDFSLLQDGLLDLYILVPRELADYVDIGFRFAGGISNGDPPYYVRKVKEASIKVLHSQAPVAGFQTTAQSFLGGLESMAPTDNDEVATMLDGENCGTTPMTCSVLPHAVNVIALPRA